MSVPARVILNSLMSAVMAELHLPAKFRSPTARDGPKHTMLFG
jgi:hypothetical protein